MTHNFNMQVDSSFQAEEAMLAYDGSVYESGHRSLLCSLLCFPVTELTSASEGERRERDYVFAHEG